MNSNSYTTDIDKTLSLAQQHAQARHARLVEEIDIFAALFQTDNPVISAVLNELKISPNEILSYIKSVAPENKTALKSNLQLSYKPSTKELFSTARQEAATLNDEITSVHHLLLAFLKSKLPEIQIVLEKFDLNYQKTLDLIKNSTQISKTPYLDKYGDDLIIKASLGKLDPLIGRFSELEQIIQTLTRRRKNNVLLYGEAGVGKTAVVEGLANLIHQGKAPKKLQGKRIIELSIYSIIAGASHRGEFEERLKEIINETKNARGQIILFIDEIHSIVSNESSDEAANILKPALARGEMQVIGATTVKEYHRYFEKDAALERRFQPIYLPEPSREECFFILKGLKEGYEKFHNLEITDEILMESIKLSQKFIAQRFLPDKAIDLLDQTCAAAKSESLTIAGKIEQAKTFLKFHLQQKNPEFEVIEKIQNELKQFESEKTPQPKNSPLGQLTTEHLYTTVQQLSGIPYPHIAAGEKEKLLALENNLAEKIIGQKPALKALTNAIKRNRAGLKAGHKPIGSFLFLGPTGVGKTETAEVLAEELFGQKNAVIRFDMSEFMEKHAQSKLIGAPPGYIGYDESGLLTEKVRTKPYSVVLFDEIEKAHPDVLNLLLQILDEGSITDSQGRTINFKNTIIILTSNLGNQIDANTLKNLSQKEKRAQIIPHIQKFLKNELINRLDELIYFDRLNQPELLQILELMIKDLNHTLHQKNLKLTLTEAARQKLIELGYEPEFGARPLKHVIQNEIETPLAELIIENSFGESTNITCDFKNSNFIFENY